MLIHAIILYYIRRYIIIQRDTAISDFVRITSGWTIRLFSHRDSTDSNFTRVLIRAFLFHAGIGGTRFISFEDRHWHNDCFICAACKTSLVGRGFITDAEDIICPECAKQKLM